MRPSRLCEKTGVGESCTVEYRIEVGETQRGYVVCSLQRRSQQHPQLEFARIMSKTTYGHTGKKWAFWQHSRKSETNSSHRRITLAGITLNAAVFDGSNGTRTEIGDASLFYRQYSYQAPLKETSMNTAQPPQPSARNIEYAKEFWTLTNSVTGFAIVQTLGFAIVVGPHRGDLFCGVYEHPDLTMRMVHVVSVLYIFLILVFNLVRVLLLRGEKLSLIVNHHVRRTWFRIKPPIGGHTYRPF